MFSIRVYPLTGANLVSIAQMTARSGATNEVMSRYCTLVILVLILRSRKMMNCFQALGRF